jgi:hypothetical protein
MFKKLRKMYHIFYIKWVMKQCHGLCITCKFKNECYDNYEDIKINVR